MPISPAKPDDFKPKSSTTVSAHIDLADSDSEEGTIKTPSRPSSASKPVLSQSQRLRNQAQETTTVLTSYLAQKASLDQKRVEQKDKRLEMQDLNAKVERAEKLLADPSLPMDKRQQLQDFILSTILT
ncbi:hypothetical protein K435DRAFT_855035 [Dendrothele bispora CBS 962.96]|nr:hypothetical protein K435DRAFT_855035 [Dendrothele bispora CBS 962.96]